MPDREKQFKELFHLEYGRMYKTAYILLGNEEEAKDAVQDVFTKLWDGSTPLREESQRTFLLTCVRNRCLNIIARRRNEHVLNELYELCKLEESERDEELLEAVNRFVDEKLTPQTSRIIRMHYDEDQSYKEISDSLGISLSAVNKHIVQGLKKLRSKFKNWHTRSWIDIAAVVIGVLMISGIVYAAYRMVINVNNMEEDLVSPNQEIQINNPQQQNLQEVLTDSIPQTRIFENMTLDKITQELALYYNKELDIQNPKANELRLYYKWELKDELESVVNDLNHFDRVNLVVEDDKLIVKP